MEESIASFCESVASFCNHIETSCNALKQSIHRHPIPLDSASSTFIQCLNRKVSSASSELNVLGSLSLETVSFEELLGHCNEIYKNNEENLLRLQDCLEPLGYVPEFEIDEEDDATDDLPTPVAMNSKILDDDDALLSSSLKDLGFSDLCLDSLASRGKSRFDDTDEILVEPINPIGLEGEGDHRAFGASKSNMQLDFEEMDNDLKPVKALSPVVKLSKDDYECLPSYMKGLAPWEDLVAAVEKINSSLNQKTTGSSFFHQDEISSMGLGPKGRSYLLLLVRMNRLVVETIDGLISYRVL
ncbi:uncharacterized protein LOC107405389 [Ziziphus jujuba]|uniref:Uncharacterized protein LOC107405389 n=1 Tax=Ziziphus jujuba TaxID=326968 RepID=A0A6P3Z1A0_ZIZJJ|nr:uncharacterized protein LOC107405389 [Ziziphus jujuba]